MDLYDDAIVSAVQPYAARKEYLCPGCDSPIPVGTFHLVVVPETAPDLRRHWHRGCWYRDLRRRLGPAQADRAMSRRTGT